MLLAAAAVMGLSACRDPMRHQPKYTPLDASSFFPNHASARPLPEGVVDRGELDYSPAFQTGMQGGKYVEHNPLPITMRVLARGRQRFDIYCSPCHGMTGDGEGMIVQRGFGPPPSFHVDRLRAAPDGHLFAVQTQGFGRMGSYASQVPVEDRWAIVAYIRALQLSQHALTSSLSPDQRRKVEGGDDAGG